MSSIAYVTDENMLEYHRLNCNHSMLFWRLSSKKKFSDFRKGDLLFFFARGRKGRKKGLVGYAHYDSTRKLSLNQMWKQYGSMTGYETKEQLREAVDKAARGEIPEKMNCLYLTDVVFFMSPVYPADAGLDIPANLESYCYLDKNDPQVTVRILQKASENGLDLWSHDESDPERVFRMDETRHIVAKIQKQIGEAAGTKKEKMYARRLTKSLLMEDGWESVRGSAYDCMKQQDGVTYIAMPFVFQNNDRELRLRELTGRMMMYKILLEENRYSQPVMFEVLSETEQKDVENITGKINERL